MSCKELDLNQQKGIHCRKGYSGLYNKCYISKEDLTKMLASGEAELVENSKGEAQIIIYKGRNESKNAPYRLSGFSSKNKEV